MKPSEAVECVALVLERWSHARMTPAQQQRYVEDVLDLDAGLATAALASLHREGRPHAPTSGELRRRAAEMELDAPEWPEVRRQIVRRAQQVAERRANPTEWACPYALCDGGGFRELADRTMERCQCYDARKAARQGTDELHPLVASWLRDGYATLEELEAVVDLDTKGRGTLEAQLRDRWGSYRERVVQSRALADLPPAPGVERLEAAHREDTRRRGGGLRRPDVLAALGAGDEDAA